MTLQHAFQRVRALANVRLVQQAAEELRAQTRLFQLVKAGQVRLKQDLNVVMLKVHDKLQSFNLKKAVMRFAVLRIV